MKNLKILNRSKISPDSLTYPDLPLLDTCFDLISDSLTLVLGSHDSNLIEIQQFDKSGNTTLLASIPFNDNDKILSCSHFEDTNQLVLVFQNGDIILATYNPSNFDIDQTLIEIVGTIDNGIKSAKWSYDEEILSLVTNDHNLLLFSRNLDLILERKIDSSDLKINNQVSLGWGKEETQFKGKGAKQIERQRKLLKNAGLNIDSDNAILCDPTIKEIQNGKISDFESFNYEISWRGDCQFFAISCIEKIDNDTDKSRRVIRVYSRDGDLISVSEPVDGQEHTLSWKPQGSLIASTQRRFEPEINDNVLDIIFFEKNGLRHGEFDSRIDANSGNIIKIDWSSNSEILLLQLENSIQLWYTKNYHWYLKQEIKTFQNEEITFTKFHPEKPFKLIIGTSNFVEIIDLSYEITTGSFVQPNDFGVNLVIDGNSCLITPFAKANVPPPISYKDINVDEPINSAAISNDNLTLAILTNNAVYLFTKDNNDSWDYKQVSKFDLDFDMYARQVKVIDNKIYVLFDNIEENESKLLVLDAQLEFLDVVEIPYMKCITLSANMTNDYLTFETIDGSINLLSNEMKNIGKFPQLCHQFVTYEIEIDGQTIYSNIGLMSSGKLYINSKLISQGVTSMLVTDSYLLYTTAQHQLKFIHLINNPSLHDETIEFIEDNNNDQIHDERVRAIERGSILINSIPCKSSVILQAQRGNLETIYPRIMVLNDIRQHIKKLDYKKAFLTCRVHRIQLDILHDYDPTLFFNNIEHFINQLEKVEYLDLFLSCLLEEDVCQTKYKETIIQNESTNNVNDITQSFKDLKIAQREKGIEKVRKICDAILDVLINNKSYKEKYLQSIITAYASQKPPRTEEALKLIATFDKDSEIEQSIQHLCFLLDVNKLYNEALSIYNIPLALVVAQQSTKDPKEYLPFLQSLYEETELRRRFMVDVYLKNYSKALESLVQIPITEKEDIDDEIIDFIIDHELYKDALGLYKNDEPKFNNILNYYAQYLSKNQHYVQSAVAYEKLNDLANALENYIMAKKWREAVSIALKPEYNDKLENTCTRLIESLNSIHDYKSSAYIAFKYLKNIRQALELYGKEYEYSAAVQLCYEEGKVELIKEVVDPSILEGFGTIAELLADCKGQIESQLKRLRELREKKLNDPYAFYGEDGEMNENIPDNVSIAPSETSTKESFFTRYTGKTSGTAKTGASRRTAKNKRREERKRARGKKGTIYEEEYLIGSVGRLLERLENTKPDAIKLLEAMVRRNMIQQAHIIQNSYVNVLQLLKDNIVEIYTIDKRDRERLDENGCIYYIDEIPVPTIKDFPVLDILDY
ncbi:hypothetical protein CANINC_002747 [Pichia inconspicua]|uniref:Elongator complex protein 1 n=1 Tax=Pichia inconspicua TaxID=52247 RepID=A0A4T0X0F8_9ASCO|nr:hypothetical protein CANINC_002747 [[Candida] inconspicua]